MESAGRCGIQCLDGANEATCRNAESETALSNRRQFLKDASKSAASFVLVAAVPVALTKPEPHPYSAEFFERVRQQVMHISRREGRPVQDLTIEAPRYLHVKIDVARVEVTATETPEGYRFVRLRLVGIQQPFTFNVAWKDWR